MYKYHLRYHWMRRLLWDHQEPLKVAIIHQRTQIRTIIAGTSSLNPERKFNSFSPFLKPRKDLTLFLWVFLFLIFLSWVLSYNKTRINYFLFVYLRFIGVRRIYSKIPVAFREIWRDDGTFHHNFLFKPTTRQIHIRRWHHFSGILSSLLGGLSFFFQRKIIPFATIVLVLDVLFFGVFFNLFDFEI